MPNVEYREVELLKEGIYGWRQAGGRLEAGCRLEAGWREAGGRLEGANDAKSWQHPEVFPAGPPPQY